MKKQAPNRNSLSPQPRKTPWFKLALVAVGLLLIPRSSSRKANGQHQQAGQGSQGRDDAQDNP